MPERQPAGLLRRLGSMCYDTLLVGALLLLLGFSFHLVIDPNHSDGWQRLTLQCLWLTATAAYFVLLWSGPTGQTLAMKTWKLRLVSHPDDGRPIDRRQALRRWLLSLLWLAPGSLLGLILAVLFDPTPATSMKLWLMAHATGGIAYALLSLFLPEQQYLHDLLGKTRLIAQLPTKPAQR